MREASAVEITITISYCNASSTFMVTNSWDTFVKRAGLAATIPFATVAM